MSLERFISKFSEKNYMCFVIVCLASVLCFCQAINAQSGRRTNKGTSSSKPPTASGESKVDPPISKPTATPNAKILSVIVLGQSRNDTFLFSRSNYFDVALKECVNNLNDYAKQSGSGLNVTNGDKMKFEQAIERAKKETDAHILWLELALKDDGYGNTVVDYMDYAVLVPQTAKRLTSGRVQPRQLNPAIGQGGILRVPSAQGRRSSLTLQIKSSAREVVNQLIHWEWL